MQIIPVLDLMQGCVVRGVAGRREEYRPIQTPLADGSDPLHLAEAFRERFGLTTLYLADLDAIAGAAPAWRIYEQLMQAGFHLCVDAGIGDVARARQMIDFAARKPRLEQIVVALESLTSPDDLALVAAEIPAWQVVFSLDLKHGEPIARGENWRGLSAEQIAMCAYSVGVRRMILLDLARVGIGTGVGTEALCRALKRQYTNLTLVAGGGVRSLADVNELAAAGCSAVLVASALHDGRLTPEMVRSLHDPCD